MSYPTIHRFVDRVRSISSDTKNFSLPAAEAKALQSEITKLLLALQDSKEMLENSQKSSDNSFEQIEKIEIHGGDF